MINPLNRGRYKSALETYDRGYYNFTLEDIEKITELNLPRNKRNYRKQKIHLRLARATKEILKKKNQMKPEGRPSAAQTVIDYLREHPDARKCDVIRGTGLDKKTVYKHYEAAKVKAAEPEPQELPGLVQSMGRANRKAPSSP